MSGTELPQTCDLAVIGAGPAGLAAAARAAALGIDTLLLDEQAAPGGQIYRAITDPPMRTRSILGDEYWRGEDLVAACAASGARMVGGAMVWSVSREREIGVLVDGAARLVRARHIILATGAMERPFPISGWTLPGVMTAGAAQIALKSSGLVAEGQVVLAGTGPLLWLLAAQYLRAGAPIAAILDTTPRANWRAALPYLPGFLVSIYLRRGLALLREIRDRITVMRDISALRALGDGCVREIAFRVGDGPEQRMPADVLLLHQGVVANPNLAAATGCAQVWSDPQLCFIPQTDIWGATSLAGIAAVGDGAGIGGAEAAAEGGRLAALDVAHRLGRLDAAERDAQAVPHQQALRRVLRGRAFLDRLYRPRLAHRIPEDETIICRCEEVTAGQLRAAAALGCTGPNQAKSFLRCGMGPCQGRMCGLTVTEVLAAARGLTPAEIGYFRLRPPIKPLPLEALASLPVSETARRAVERS